MRAEILSIGTELLLGEIVDTNAAYLARRLAMLAIDCFRIVQIGDNLPRCAEAIERALSRCDLLICTGGLGPTEDDLTREAIAQALGEAPTVDPGLERELRGWFAAREFAMPERNRKQAWLIPSARAIPNPNGTAPGWWVRRDGREVVALPGVPREMTSMWEHNVEPELAGRSGGHLVARTLKVLGLGESALEEALGELTRSLSPTLATYAKADGVHVRIAAKHASREAAASAVAEMERSVRERIGDHVWGVDDEALVEVIGRALRVAGWRLAVRETITGGAVAAMLCEAGVPEWFAGGVVGRGIGPEAEVVLDVQGEAGAARIVARTPKGARELAVRFGSIAEGRRRATLAALDALRRALSEPSPRSGE